MVSYRVHIIESIKNSLKNLFEIRSCCFAVGQQWRNVDLTNWTWEHPFTIQNHRPWCLAHIYCSLDWIVPGRWMWAQCADPGDRNTAWILSTMQAIPLAVPLVTAHQPYHDIRPYHRLTLSYFAIAFWQCRRASMQPL